MGKAWATLFPQEGKTPQIHLPELDSYRVVDARFDNGSTTAVTGVLMVLGEHNGKYDRMVFRFNDTFQKYDVRFSKDVSPAGLNFTVLDTGVCIAMTEEEKLEVFSVRMGSAGMKVVEDPVLGGDMVLYKRNGKVIFPRGNVLHTMGLK